MMRMFPLVAVLLLPAVAAAADLHQLWDRQCGGCHGHAGPFVRETLDLVDGQLRDRRSGRDVAVFLRGHNGGYPPEVIAAITEMMAAQAATPELFRVHCGTCHETAAQLVRDQVIERDGVLVALASGRPLEAFLPSHSRLSEDETKQILDALRRVYGEIHRAP